MSGFLDKHYAAKTVEEVGEVYDAWAPTYEQELQGEYYAGANSVAQVVIEFVSDDQASILDIGCGTGLIGQTLANAGFSNLHGIDLSVGMLESARANNCYLNLEQVNLLEPLAMPSFSYDVIVSSGVFTNSLLGPEVLDKVLTLVKPGGYAIIGINSVAFIEQKYDARIRAMIEPRAGEILECREMPYWPSKDVSSRVAVIQLHSA